jgi:hypothetical protein
MLRMPSSMMFPCLAVRWAQIESSGWPIEGIGSTDWCERKSMCKVSSMVVVDLRLDDNPGFW